MDAPGDQSLCHVLPEAKHCKLVSNLGFSCVLQASSSWVRIVQTSSSAPASVFAHEWSSVLPQNCFPLGQDPADDDQPQTEDLDLDDAGGGT